MPTDSTFTYKDKYYLDGPGHYTAEEPIGDPRARYFDTLREAQRAAMALYRARPDMPKVEIMHTERVGVQVTVYGERDVPTLAPGRMGHE